MQNFFNDLPNSINGLFKFDNWSKNDVFNALAITERSILLIFISFWLFLVVSTVATYVFNGYTLMFIGQKAGLDTNWMPFVPFARTVYRLQILKESWWKLFFLEYDFLFASIFIWLMWTIFGVRILTFTIVIVVLYIGAATVYKMIYSYKFYKAFDFNPYLALVMLTPLNSLIQNVTNCFIAYNNKYTFLGVNNYYRSNAGYSGARQTPPPPPQPKPVSSGSITGVAGLYVNQTFDLQPGEELIFGRDTSLSHIIFEANEEKISRKHCGVKFDAANNSYLVTDYSTNGTFLGDTRVGVNIPSFVSKGSVIALGNKQNQFRLN